MAKGTTGNAGKLARLQTSLARKRKESKELTSNVVGMGVSIVTGGALGFARGKLKDDSGNWDVPKTEIPWELPIGLLLGGAGLMGFGGIAADPMLEAGKTSLAVLANRFGESKGAEKD